MPTRRRTVAVVGSALLAGCTFGGGSSEGETTDGTTTETETTETTTTTTTTEATTTESTTTTTTEGCGRGRPDLVVKNEANEEETVVLEVRNSDEDTLVLDTAVSVGVGNTESFANRVRKAGAYRVTVTVPGGPATIYNWNVGESEQECNDHGLVVTVTEDEIQFTEK